MKLLYQQSGIEIMYLGGLSIGNVEKGIEHQGGLVFRVSKKLCQQVYQLIINYYQRTYASLINGM